MRPRSLTPHSLLDTLQSHSSPDNCRSQSTPAKHLARTRRTGKRRRGRRRRRRSRWRSGHEGEVGAGQASRVRGVDDDGAVAEEAGRARRGRGVEFKVARLEGTCGDVSVLADEITDLACFGLGVVTQWVLAAKGSYCRVSALLVWAYRMTS